MIRQRLARLAYGTASVRTTAAVGIFLVFSATAAILSENKFALACCVFAALAYIELLARKLQETVNRLASEIAREHDSRPGEE